MDKQSKPLPIRYRQDRPYGAKLDVLAREIANGARLSEGEIFRRCYWLVTRTPASALTEPVEEDFASAENLAAYIGTHEAMYQREAILAKSYVMFASAGGQVFEFSKSLTDLFLRSDVDDVPAAGLHLPYDRFFIHYQQAIALEGGENGSAKAMIDGAYVERIAPDLIAITPGTPRIALGYEQEWLCENEDALLGGMVLRLGNGTLANAVNEAVGIYVEDNRKRVVQTLQEQRLRESGRPLSSWACDLISKATLNHLNHLDGVGSLRPAVHQLVNLIANTLCYITAYRESGRTKWSEGTPREVVDALARATSPKRQAQIEKELIWAGYRRVTLFALEADSNSAPARGTHASPAAHWRKGHWRMQAHGESHSLRRLQWIRPCLIKPQGPRMIEGRVYVAEREFAPSF